MRFSRSVDLSVPRLITRAEIPPTGGRKGGPKGRGKATFARKALIWPTTSHDQSPIKTQRPWKPRGMGHSCKGFSVANLRTSSVTLGRNPVRHPGESRDPDAAKSAQYGVFLGLFLGRSRRKGVRRSNPAAILKVKAGPSRTEAPFSWVQCKRTPLGPSEGSFTVDGKKVRIPVFKVP